MKRLIRCATCMHSLRKGLLWLGGGDYLECPDCGATGVVEYDESCFTPKERTVFIPGLRPHTERVMPVYLRNLT